MVDCRHFMAHLIGTCVVFAMAVAWGCGTLESSLVSTGRWPCQLVREQTPLRFARFLPR